MLTEFKEGVLAKLDEETKDQHLRKRIEAILDRQIAEPDFAGAHTLSVEFLRKLDSAHRILEEID